MKEMICSACFRAFMLPAKTTWLSGERMPCPFCKSRDTSPMLSAKVDGRRLDSFMFAQAGDIREKQERLIVEARS